jgi:hypothetical protein
MVRQCGSGSPASRAGTWNGTYRLRLPGRAPEVSSSVAFVVAVIGSRFVRIDYTWATQGKPQEGSILLGYEAKGRAATAARFDTWHMGEKIMLCRGRVERSGGGDVLGSYAVPSSRDRGWRTVVEPGARTFRLWMYNISQRGEEVVVYARAPMGTPRARGRRPS